MRGLPANLFLMGINASEATPQTHAEKHEGKQYLLVQLAKKVLGLAFKPCNLAIDLAFYKP